MNILEQIERLGFSAPVANSIAQNVAVHSRVDYGTFEGQCECDSTALKIAEWIADSLRKIRSGTERTSIGQAEEILESVAILSVDWISRRHPYSNVNPMMRVLADRGLSMPVWSLRTKSTPGEEEAIWKTIRATLIQLDDTQLESLASIVPESPDSAAA